MFRLITILLGCLLLATPHARALTPHQARDIYQRIRPSLVVVQYTLDGEFGRREISGQGVVVSEDGMVMTTLALFPPQLPDEQMKEFKILIPDDDDTEIDAAFLGRDERSEWAFVKATGSHAWKPLAFDDLPVDVGDIVLSVGLLPKEAGYTAYLTQATVAANLRGPIPQVLIGGGSLASLGSPVLNVEGRVIGMVPYQPGQTPLLSGGSGGGGGSDPMPAITNPPRLFVRAREFLRSLADPPTGTPLRIPWIGCQLSAVTKQVAEYYNLKGVPAVQIGEVIPDSPAAKAGLRPGDKIVKIDGEALERGDRPEETPLIMIRKLRWRKVGDEMKLTVVRDRDAPPLEMTVKLEEQPRQANQARRFFAEDLGLSVREVVFADTYAKRLPADARGVVVAFVRPASSAASAGLRVGDFVTQLNKDPVTDLDAFQKQLEDFRRRKPRDVVVLVVIRDQKTEVIRIEPPQ